MRWPVRKDGFDPMKQSWLEGAISAVETFAGGVTALVAGFCTYVTISMLRGGRVAHPGQLTPLEGLGLSLGLGAMGASFLWAGLSLMFGWQTTWRTQAVPVVTLLFFGGSFLKFKLGL